ncbi:MAG: hypothetical protein ACRENG_16775, partial [bacterium]
MKLANRFKQPYSKRRIRLYDQAEKVDLLEKLSAGLMEVVRGIGTDGDPLWSIKLIKIVYDDRAGKLGTLALGCAAVIFDPVREKVLLVRRLDNGLWG